MKSAPIMFLLSVIALQLWLPTVYSSCALARRRQIRSKPPYENRRQWKPPGPARRPEIETTEEPFDPRKENENFTGTTPPDDQCTTRERLYNTISTTLLRVSFGEDCDNQAFYCSRAYDTGIICGRTMYFVYETFHSYCLLDYVNCMQRYEMWHIVHMGKCFDVPNLKDYDHYSYRDDFFLDNKYIVE